MSTLSTEQKGSNQGPPQVDPKHDQGDTVKKQTLFTKLMNEEALLSKLERDRSILRLEQKETSLKIRRLRNNITSKKLTLLARRELAQAARPSNKKPYTRLSRIQLQRNEKRRLYQRAWRKKRRGLSARYRNTIRNVNND